MPSFLQAGQGYRAPELPAEIMDYVYSYHSRLVATPGDVQTPGRVDLFRVPKDQMADRGGLPVLRRHRRRRRCRSGPPDSTSASRS